MAGNSDEKKGALTRRGFLKTCGLGAIGIAGASWTAAEEAGISAPADQVGVLVDIRRCIGCRSCENACRQRWGFSGLAGAGTGYASADGRLTHRTRTFIDEKPAGILGGARAIPVKRQCMHCLEPACVSVCPVAALAKSPRGAVVYHESKCIGCRYCLLACPFDVPRFEWDSGLFPSVGKCDLCDDRVAAGGQPACVESCPTGALKFGKREALLDEARARRKSDLSGKAHIYGEDVVGGTSWIYLTDVPLRDAGVPDNLPKRPLPSLTQAVTRKVPMIIGLVLAFLSAVLWRRLKAQGHGPL